MWIPWQVAGIYSSSCAKRCCFIDFSINCSLSSMATRFLCYKNSWIKCCWTRMFYQESNHVLVAFLVNFHTLASCNHFCGCRRASPHGSKILSMCFYNDNNQLSSYEALPPLLLLLWLYLDLLYYIIMTANSKELYNQFLSCSPGSAVQLCLPIFLLFSVFFCIFSFALGFFAT